MEREQRSEEIKLISHLVPPLSVLTLASLLMVQQREAEVMLWVKFEATSTEYLDGKALDSQ